MKYKTKLVILDRFYNEIRNQHEIKNWHEIRNQYEISSNESIEKKELLLLTNRSKTNQNKAKFWSLNMSTVSITPQ